MESAYKHIDKYVEHLGITRGVLDGWMRRGLEKHVHYVVIGHQTFMHVERMDQWISESGQLESDQAVAESRSDSSGEKPAFTVRQFPGTRTARVTSPQR